MIKTYFLLLIAFCLAAAPAAAIETEAKQAFMMDATTHTVMLSKNADELMPPSSMSKLMTTYILFQRLKEGRIKLTDTLKVSEKAWRTQGSKTFVKVGDEVTIENLMHGIITQSGNDACIVVAEGISGSEEAFAEEMNRVAASIGMKHSHFTNSTGLPDENHVMTAKDLAILSDRIVEDFPEYYDYFSLPEFTYNGIKQYNRNRLLKSDLGVDGLKTGHTEAGGYGIALSAKKGDRRIILIVNGLTSEDQREQEGDRLLRHGFREFKNQKLISKGQQVDQADVWFGKQPVVPLTVDHDVLITMPIAGADKLSMTLNYTGPVPAPIKQGDHIADLLVEVPGNEPQTIPLVAAADVEKLSGLSRVWAVLKSYIRH